MGRIVGKINRLIKGVFKKQRVKKIIKDAKIQNNKIVFLTFQGEYTCNPKGIAEEIIKQNLPYEMTWVLVQKKTFASFPLNMKLVRRGSVEFYREIATAKIVIDNTNTLQRQKVIKMSGQTWIQTWHGSLGIKRLDGDIVKNRSWEKIRELCEKQTDYLISNSAFETEVFGSSYWKGVPVLNYGHARNDILFLEESSKSYIEIKEKIYKRYNIDLDKKLFLYAPTHNDEKEFSLDDIDYASIKTALENKFGGEWVILIRLHSRFVKSEINRELSEKFGNKVINVTNYPDMQDLLLVIDSGMTDFSSWVFDYIFRKKPTFILTENKESFEERRGFYFPLAETPFPLAESMEVLLENIDKFDETEYKDKIDIFLNERGCFEDGKASERIVEKLNEISGVS